MGYLSGSRTRDRVQCWATVDRDDPELGDRLEEWQFFYSGRRPHSSLGGKAPIDRCCDLLPDTPFSAEVWDACNHERACVRERDFQQDLKALELNRFL